MMKFCYSDKDGPYYWHIKSGTIQREAPEDQLSKTEARKSFVKDNDSVIIYINKIIYLYIENKVN